MSKVFIGLCAFVMLVITPTVHADPIVITSGSLTVVGVTGSPSYSLVGGNFSVNAVQGDPGNTPSCFPCASGDLTSISSFLVGTSLGQGTATINGTTFNNLFFLGEFSLGVSPILLPPGTTNLTITAPFSFIGNIQGCEGNEPVCDNVVFSVDLVGQGIATAQFNFAGLLANGATLYTFQSVTYNFQTAAIPEPMTITLLATGLIGLGAKLRSRIKSRKVI